jgi:hypothetical protein
MRVRIPNLTFGMVVSMAITTGLAFGQTANIVAPPQGGVVIGLSGNLGYLYGGTIGVTLALEPSDDVELFTFDMTSGNVLDQVDVTAVFGLEVVRGGGKAASPAPTLSSGPFDAAIWARREAATAKTLSSGFSATLSFPVYLQTFPSKGLVAVYGRETRGVPARNQQVAMFSANSQGLLTMLWQQSYQSPGVAPQGIYPTATFNSDGSGLYVLYMFAPPGSGGEVDSAPPGSGSAAGPVSTVALLNTADGTTAGSTAVPNFALLGGGIADDPMSKRVVLLTGSIIYVIPEDQNNVAISSTIQPDPQLTDGATITSLVGIADGQYAISYAFTGFPNHPADSLFLSTDLNSGVTTQALAPDSLEMPYSNLIVFDPVGGRVIVPYSIKVTLLDSGQAFLFSTGGNKVSLIPVSADGSLTKAAQASLPKNKTNPAVIENTCNAVASATGTMVFVAASNGVMFTVDATTGAVINSVSLDPTQLVWISLDEATNQLVFNDGKTLGIIAAPDQPTVSSVTVKDGQMSIKGNNFLSGATVTINGKNAPIAPGGISGHEIIIDHNHSLNRGRQASVMVTNPDKRVSRPFNFRNGE